MKREKIKFRSIHFENEKKEIITEFISWDMPIPREGERIWFEHMDGIRMWTAK